MAHYNASVVLLTLLLAMLLLPLAFFIFELCFLRLLLLASLVLLTFIVLLFPPFWVLLLSASPDFPVLSCAAVVPTAAVVDVPGILVVAQISDVAAVPSPYCC